MPVEIREMNIRANVEKLDANMGKSEALDSYLSTQEMNKIKKEIIDECMDKVIKYLEKSKRR